MSMTKEEAKAFVQSQLASFADIHDDLDNTTRLARMNSVLTHIFTVFRANGFVVFDDYTKWPILNVGIRIVTDDEGSKYLFPNVTYGRM